MTDPDSILPCFCFRKFAVEVAKDLIGRTITVHHAPESSVQATIIETEAYGGVDDPASHAAFRPGGRASQMFCEAGSIYVYAAYGMYPCLNIVTDDVGLPGAVLIRGARFHDTGIEVSGPGRTAKALGITLANQAETVCGNRIQISRAREKQPVARTGRVGISRGTTIQWRFVVSKDASEYAE